MKYKELAKKLKNIAKEDQEIRKKVVKGWAEKDIRAMERFDKKSTAELKEIVKEIGWPTIGKVGEEASKAAWLIVQHSPNAKFQQNCLELMEQCLDDIDPKNYAYLKDRLLVQAGKPQVYGTQSKLDKKTGKTQLYPLQDPDKVNALRKEVGLEPLETTK
jgi:hypothetical protein